jgi:hypothetical protein
VPGKRLSDRDRRLLEFLAEHRLVLERQIDRLLGAPTGDTSARLLTLADEGYLSYRRGFGGDLRWWWIRRRGLDAIGSELPAPRLKFASYKHDVGLAWLWLAAQRGTFGPLREVLSERRLRSSDGALQRNGEPWGIRLGGVDRHGYERLHYPDLLLIDPEGHRIALELELTPKGVDRREKILGGYGADGRVRGVLYLVEETPSGRAIQRLVEASTRRMDLTDRVAVQLVKPIIAFGDEAGKEAGQLRDQGRSDGESRATSDGRSRRAQAREAVR